MRKKIVIIVIGVALLLEGIFLPYMHLSEGKTNTVKNSQKIQQPPIAAETTSFAKELTNENQEERPEHNPILTLRAKKIYSKNKKILVLVNAEHAFKQSYQANLQPICNGRLNASACLYDALVQMLADATAEGGFQYWIASAWRSQEKQQKLIDEDVRSAMQRGLSYEDALLETYKETMPAGHSEHETGLALDILCSGNMNMDRSQAEEPGNIWLRENCCRYGFILRYPEEKEEITGVNYEPWHLRYVGKEAAKFLKKHNLTLEEYWQLL